MLALTAALAATGIMQSDGSEWTEELHGALAYTFAALVGAHVAGVLWHTLRHRENIARSMIDGRKQGHPSLGIDSSKPVVGLVFLLLVGGFSWQLWTGYDSATGTVAIPLTGQTIRLGEREGSERTQTERRDHDEEHHDD